MPKSSHRTEHQDILDANAKVEDKTVKDGSSLKDAESAVENADTALGVAEANDKLSDAELNKCILLRKSFRKG